MIQERLDCKPLPPIHMRNDLAIEVLEQILAQTEPQTERVDTRGVMVTQDQHIFPQRVYNPETERITIEEEVRTRIQQMLNLARDDPNIQIALLGVEKHNIKKIDIPTEKQNEAPRSKLRGISRIFLRC